MHGLSYGPLASAISTQIGDKVEIYQQICAHINTIYPILTGQLICVPAVLIARIEAWPITRKELTP
jgi:hypothetical protein